MFFVHKKQRIFFLFSTHGQGICHCRIPEVLLLMIKQTTFIRRMTVSQEIIIKYVKRNSVCVSTCGSPS